MLKKTITYEDYNGIERTEDFYFNLTKAELTKLEIVNNGYSDMIQKIIDAKDNPLIMKTFEDIILMSYGEKSSDGKRFIKSEEISKAFTQTEAYDQLFMELLTDTNAASDFINGIIPKNLAEQVAKEQQKQLS